MEVLKEQEIAQVEMKKPHVVVLGAGASYASLPKGDKNGRRLPLMNNLIDVLGIGHLMKKIPLTFKDSNFESIYSEIHRHEELSGVRMEIEAAVHEYFSKLVLPEEPTIYDHLILSLRHKDTIATFNWDPLLVQAIERNMDRFRPPQVLFLHGNVKMGYCPDGHQMGLNGRRCMNCNKFLEPSRLLFPVGDKNYQSDIFLSKQWEMLRTELRRAFMVTIFGYGAPASDAGAIELFKQAWGSVNQRNMEEFEIIDIRSEDELAKTWSPFIHSHHYRVENNFYDSWIANHPRRTGEAYINQFISAKFIEDNPLPRNAGFPELWAWYEKLHAIERAVGA